MSAGRVWRLSRRVCNRYGPSRIYLIVDCYAGDMFQARDHGEAPDSADAELLPQPDQSQIDEAVVTATGSAEPGYDRAAETTLLELVYRYALPEGRVSDLIGGMHRPAPRRRRAVVAVEET
jgi:hypothetical protein